VKPAPITSIWLISTTLAVVGCEGKPLPPMASVPLPSSGVSAAPLANALLATPVPQSASAVASVEAPSAPPFDLGSAPKLLADDGKPLVQTEDRPKADSTAFKARMDLLWKAIVADDAAMADNAFFPVVAYEQVKDIEKPASDWKHRLVKAFARGIHDYHQKLGKDAAKAKLIAVEVDEDRVKWMGPGKEGNKVGYFRVTRSRVRYRDAAGAEKKFELTSLISWRGEWFVVHLDGFK
jgi:hypothetical protein